MQSYTRYKVSEFLKDRHPYVPPKPTPLMDPEQVAIAYNERCVPKLSDLLIYEKLTPEKRRDALHTLNELVSHQETKEIMIQNNIVQSTVNLMADNNEEVRTEAAELCGSLLFLDVGRKEFNSSMGNYKILQAILFDKFLSVRESAGWLIYRFSLHKEGVEMLYNSLSITKMVDAFNTYSTPSRIEDNYKFILFLLEAFINCTMYDFAIQHTLQHGFLKAFNIILRDRNQYYSTSLSPGVYEQILELVLCVLKNITLVKEGKKEAFDEGLIYTISWYLDSKTEKERLYSSSFMMSVGNILEAKKQISDYTFNLKFEILEKLCFLLEDPDEDIKNNSNLALRILSDLPDAFLKIVDIIHDKLALLDGVFGARSLNGLCELLPKLSKYKNPPHIDKEFLPRYSKYIRGIIYFIKKYPEESLEIIVHEIVNFAQKLGPFCLLNDPQIQKQAKYIKNKICSKDPHNAQILQKFLEQYCEKDKNISKDIGESLHLSELI